MNLKQAIFNAEAVAHLKGYEQEILPLTDKVREMYDIMQRMNTVSITACSGLDDDYLNPILVEFIEFMRNNPMDTKEH